MKTSAIGILILMPFVCVVSRSKDLDKTVNTNTLTCNPVSNVYISLTCLTTQVTEHVKSAITDFQSRTNEWNKLLQTWLYEQRYMLAGTTVVGMYATLVFTVYETKRYLADTTHWSAWKSDLPLATLLATAPAQLTKELLLEMQQRYTNPVNPINNIVDPIITFIATIKEEKKKLIAYQTIHNYLATSRIVKCVPGCQDPRPIIKEHLERLAYVTTLFEQWIAQYNATHAGLFAVVNG